MRILLTNFTLAWRTGTEIVVRDLALRLKRRGHDPVVYTPEAGAIADEIRDGDVPVVTTLQGLHPPDVIHAHHGQPSVTAALRFPDVPMIYVCHDARSFFDEAPLLPQIARYVAVDDVCRDRLRADGAPEPIAVVRNGVDLERFRQRGPLPDVPTRAAIFSNHQPNTEIIRRACSDAGIVLDVIGLPSGDGFNAAPERVLGDYDIVFAKARSALEAAAVGCAVVLCDSDGLGPMLGPSNMESLRRLNFGFRTLTDPTTWEGLAARIAAYSAVDAAAVTSFVRSTADLDDCVSAYERLYEEARSGHLAVDAQDTFAAAARWLETQTSRLALHAETERQRVMLETQLAAAAPRIAELERRLADAEQAVAALHHVAAAYHALASSPLVRARDGLARLPLVGAAMRHAGALIRRVLPGGGRP